MQGQGLRDSARTFDELDCVILGASFDTPEENRAFADAQEFPFPLLSADRDTGEAYEVIRSADHAYAAYPERFSYLIDPAGVIRRSYVVTDVVNHADHVIADLRELADG